MPAEAVPSSRGIGNSSPSLSSVSYLEGLGYRIYAIGQIRIGLIRMVLHYAPFFPYRISNLDPAFDSSCITA